eukprot:TRINITY_DN6231_c0_g1_i1.p1 TRINITY_DN6231_c0_g1~~TRINITY_DN6231_c0_g1_i1.p1  ORF type:complete len:229 (-),score=37.84 TRINITY_DN6231_c0_g1_i1:83-769(-)
MEFPRFKGEKVPHEITEPLYQYLLNMGVRETEIQTRLREETSKLPRCSMMGSVDSVALLTLLVKLMNARNCMEVGVFTGYTSLAIALALPKDGKLVGLDIDENYTNIGRPFWKEAGVEDKITLHIAPALETIDRFLIEGKAGTFDFIFLDADKNNYPHYYERLLSLLRVGGLLAVDNVLWSGKVIDQNDQTADTLGVREINKKIRVDDRVSTSFLHIGDGVTLVYKNK